MYVLVNKDQQWHQHGLRNSPVLQCPADGHSAEEDKHTTLHTIQPIHAEPVSARLSHRKSPAVFLRAFDRPISIAFLSTALLQSCRHDNAADILLPNHTPKVTHGFWHGPLRCNKPAMGHVKLAVHTRYAWECENNTLQTWQQNKVSQTRHTRHTRTTYRLGQLYPDTKLALIKSDVSSPSTFESGTRVAAFGRTLTSAETASCVDMAHTQTHTQMIAQDPSG